MSSRPLVVAGLAASLIAGCGFHLAGTRPLPPALTSVYIDFVTPYRVSKPPMETSVRARLLRRGGEVLASAGEARSVLKLSELTEHRRVLSVDRFGKAVEFELTTSVRYEFFEQGRPRLTADTLEVSRDYSFNAQQVLAKEAEESRLQTFIQEELAELLILRLDALLTQEN